MRPRREGMRGLAAIAAAAAATGGIATTASANPYAGQITTGSGTGSYYLNQAADSVVVTTGPNGTGIVLQTLSGSNVATAGQHSFTIPASDTTGAFYVTVNQNSGSGFLAPSGSNGANLIGTPFTVAGGRGIAVDQNPGGNFGRIYISSSGAGIIAQNADQSAAFGFNNAPQTAGLPVATSLPYRMTVGPDGFLYVDDFSSTAGNIYRVANNLSGSAALYAGNTQASTTNATTNNHGESLSKPLVRIDGSGNLIVTATDGYLNLGGTPASFQGIYSYSIPNSSVPALGSTVTPGTARPVTTLIANPGSNGTSGVNTVSGAVVTDIAKGPKDGRFYWMADRLNGTAQASLYITDSTGQNLLYDSLVASGGAAQSNGTIGLTGQADPLQNVNGVTVSPDNKYIAFIVTSTSATNGGAGSNTGNAVIVVPLNATINGVPGLPNLAQEIYIPNAFSSATGNGRDIVFDAADNLYGVSSGTSQFLVLSPGGASSFTTGFDGVNYSFVANAVPEPAALGLLSLGALGLARRRKARHDPPDGTA